MGGPIVGHGEIVRHDVVEPIWPNASGRASCRGHVNPIGPRMAVNDGRVVSNFIVRAGFDRGRLASDEHRAGRTYRRLGKALDGNSKRR